MQQTDTLGVRLDAAPSLDTISEWIAAAIAADTRLLITFVNPASVVLAQKDPRFATSLKAFDAVLPDGTGTVMALRLLHHCPAARISFDSTSLAPLVFSMAQENKLKVALVGGEPGVAEGAAAQIRLKYDLSIATFDGYDTIDNLVTRVLATQPRLVVVGMGSGQQELLLLGLSNRNWRGIGVTCGGYLDQLSGGFNYYPTMVDRLNLRFAYRLLKEPKRLWRRYLLEYPHFVALLSRDLLFRNRT